MKLVYCRSKCGPRLDESGCEKLSNRYCQMRSGAGDMERETGKRGAIPLTVRQLEAIIRISESQAKMKLKQILLKKTQQKKTLILKQTLLRKLMKRNQKKKKKLSQLHMIHKSKSPWMGIGIFRYSILYIISNAHQLLVSMLWANSLSLSINALRLLL